MEKEASSVWKPKQFLPIKNNILNNSFLPFASDVVKKLFEFLQGYNYVLSQSKLINESEFSFIYINEEVNKKIDIRLWIYNDVERFFLTISVIRIPYKVVNDLVDFDTYLEKNSITFPPSLEGKKINREAIQEYINNYTGLFKAHGIHLITTHKQFPHYYTEWT